MEAFIVQVSYFFLCQVESQLTILFRFFDPRILTVVIVIIKHY